MFNFWSWTKYFYFYYLNKKAALFQLDSDIKDYFAFLLNYQSEKFRNKTPTPIDRFIFAQIILK